MRTLLSAFALTSFMWTSVPVAAESLNKYMVDSPQGLRDANSTLEIESVFWYGCTYCSHWDKVLTQWASSRPEVTVIKVAAPLNDVMNGHARLYHTVNILGFESEIHPEIYSKVIHSSENQLSTGENVVDFLSGRGVPSHEIRDVFYSEAVSSAVLFDYHRLKNYDLAYTPALVVDGKYLINGTHMGGLPGILERLDAELMKRIAEKN